MMTLHQQILKAVADYALDAHESGRIEERQRIIKLLEDRQRRTGDKYAGIANLDHRMIGIAIEEELGRAMALIKDA